MKVEQRIKINAQPELIFQYLMDVENRKDYIPALEEVIMIDPLPIKLGSRYVEVANIAGRRMKTTYQVIQIEENKRISARTLKSVFPIRADLIIEPFGQFSDLSVKLDFQLKGIFLLASGIVRGIVNQQAKGILEKLKLQLDQKDKF